MNGWRLHRARGGSGTISHQWFTIAPGCPEERHPTRWCACKIHRTQADALAYIGEQLERAS